MKFGINTLNIKKGINYLRYNGIGGLYSTVQYKMSGPGLAYNGWYKSKHEVTTEQLALQKEASFDYAPKFGILVSAYKTPTRFLTEMIESVLAQSYENWELCIVDGGMDMMVEPVVAEYIQTEPRIKYKKLEQTFGISYSKNAALSMTDSDYIVLLDHDDKLTADALYEMASALNERRYRLLYSDEDKMSVDGTRFSDPMFKPDFNLDLIRSHNYISRLLVVETELVKEIGGFRKEFDGAQDYDLILRCMEVLAFRSRQNAVLYENLKNSEFINPYEDICHIPRILYHWRMNDKSQDVALSKKEFARDAGRRALQEYLHRQNSFATVSLSETKGFCRVNYDTPANPKISIVVCGAKKREVMEKSILPLYEKARYSNFEVIVVDTDPLNKEVQKFYRGIEKIRKNIKVIENADLTTLPQMRNFGAARATADYILFLDGNTEILDATAIGDMLGVCLREDVAVCAGTLYNDNLSTLHAGVAIGVNGSATYLYQGIRRGMPGYLMYNRANCDYSAVSASCMLVKTEIFRKLGGFSEKFASDLADFDFCLRVRQRNKQIVVVADAGWYYHKAGSEDVIASTTEEQELFFVLWNQFIEAGDPFYNANFARDGAPFTL